MRFDDWLLAFHVLSAFALVAGIVFFWVMIVAVRGTDTPEGTIRMAPAAKVGNAAAGIGGVGTIVFGIWLAFSVGGYDIWDGWIIAALVLWALATGCARLAHGLHRHRLGDGRQAGLTRPPPNDHGLHTREPAIGRQIQGSPLALRRSLRRTSSDFLRMCASACVTEQPDTCPSPTR